MCRGPLLSWILVDAVMIFRIRALYFAKKSGESVLTSENE